MKATFPATDPNEISFSLTVTMPLKKWRELKAQLTDKYPSWELSRAITDMVFQAQKSFAPELNDDQQEK
jgi:hypothetical protein